MNRKFIITAIILCLHFCAPAQYKLEQVFYGASAIQFISSTEGFSYVDWMGGTTPDRIYHTTDAGYTWRLMASNVRANTGGMPDLEHISFVDSNTAFCVVGDYFNGKSFIYKTTNGGTTWNQCFASVVDSPWLSAPLIYNCYFADAMHGWAGGNYTIIGTTDGGATWHEQFHLGVSGGIMNVYGRSISFVNNHNGYMAGDGSSILHTTDGSTWTIQHLDTARTSSGAIADLFCNELEDVYFTDSLHGYIGSDNGAYMTTTDGGATWDELTNSYPYDNNGISLSAGNTLWVCGGPFCDNTGCYTNESILYKKDTGPWQVLTESSLVYDPYNDGFAKIHFINPALGYLSNSDGYVYRITDTSVTTGVNNVVKNGPVATIYPNPATDYISISLNQETTGTIDVYNVMGQRVITGTPVTIDKTTLDISMLPTGHYSVTISTQEGITTSTFDKL